MSSEPGSRRLAFSVNMAVFVLFFQGELSSSGLPWWLWFVLILVLLLLLLVGLVRQIRSGEQPPIANEHSAAPIVARESAEVSVAETLVTPASEPDDGVLAEIDKEVAAQEPGPQDDLQRIEGIGPKVAMILNDDGIITFTDLATAGEDHLRRLLEEAGIRSAFIGTWPEQARLAAAGQWTELEAYNSILRASRKR